jgi:hypothetical protein
VRGEAAEVRCVAVLAANKRPREPPYAYGAPLRSTA